MREILFRGKRKDTGEWVEGYIGEAYDGKRNVPMISRPSKKNLAGSTCDEIIPETVGQYTGLKDKNGKPIFEGDIVKYKQIDFIGYIRERTGQVVFWDRMAMFYILSTIGDGWDFPECEDIEVIGNIHDNSELMKGETE